MAAQRVQTSSTELTETQSQTYLRNLLRASFSSILYLRGIFDESLFTDRTICGTYTYLTLLEPHQPHTDPTNCAFRH